MGEEKKENGKSALFGPGFSGLSGPGFNLQVGPGSNGLSCPGFEPVEEEDEKMEFPREEGEPCPDYRSKIESCKYPVEDEDEKEPEFVPKTQCELEDFLENKLAKYLDPRIQSLRG